MKSEEGFAIYLAMGFIVLMTTLVASVGDFLNIALLREARTESGQALLLAADGATQQGLAALIATSGVLPSDATDPDIATDRATCLQGKVAFPTDYVGSTRRVTGDFSTRYFMREGGGLYRIFGCALQGDKSRQTVGEWLYAPPDFLLQRARQY